jgi:PAS domain S-box-containing protein
MDELSKNIDIITDKFKSFSENAGIGIVIFDKNGKHLDINPAFCGMTGYEKQEIVDTTFPPKYWPKHFTNALDNEMHKLIELGFIKTESYFKRENSTMFPVSITGSFVKNQNGINTEFVLLVQDISDTKQSERELKLTQEMLIAINKKLEKKVLEKTSEVNQLLKQKDDFIKILGHDLKNPLSPLITLVPILEKKITDPQSQKLLSVIHRNVDYMRNLIVRTIELARLDSPNVTLNFENISVRDELINILEKNVLMFQDKDIMVKNELESDVIVSVDKLRFTELLDNILSNAVKYSPNSSTIICKSIKSMDGFIDISIQDEGAGMTKDQLEKMFEDFYRADPSHRDFTSSGLGLGICKRIVERHGGKIWAESPGLGKGTSIFFRIPIDELGRKKLEESNIEINKDLQKQNLEIISKSNISENSQDH